MNVQSRARAYAVFVLCSPVVRAQDWTEAQVIEPSLMMPGIIISFIFSEERRLLLRALPF
jgi:hypothetical protein